MARFFSQPPLKAKLPNPSVELWRQYDPRLVRLVFLTSLVFWIAVFLLIGFGLDAALWHMIKYAKLRYALAGLTLLSCLGAGNSFGMQGGKLIMLSGKLPKAAEKNTHPQV